MVGLEGADLEDEGAIEDEEVEGDVGGQWRVESLWSLVLYTTTTCT